MRLVSKPVPPQFVKSLIWNRVLFAMAENGDIYRFWFKSNGEGPIYQRLIGQEPEFAEPIAELQKGFAAFGVSRVEQ